MKEKFPLPKADIRAYRINMILRFFHHPRTLWNFIKYKLSGKTSNLNYQSVKLDIEHVSRCNFRCVMCQVSEWDNRKRAEDMQLEDFKQLINQQYGLYEIKLQGLGEPLLHPDFFEMIRYARRQHIWVRIATNGSLLHINENYKKLIDTGVNEVLISIDGTTKEVFEKIRQGANFEKIMENCRLINNYCNSKGLLKTRMWTVLQKENFHQLLDFPYLAKELNFRRLSFSLGLSDWGEKSWSKKNEQISVDKFLEEKRLQDVVELAKKLKIDVSFWRIKTKYSKKNICPWPFERAYISSDMRIVPCCKVSNPETVDFGDAKDFISAWKGSVYREFRESHLYGKPPPFCKSCYEHED
jgi:pyrroloquinoline quinone biosynthesis protein E